MMNKICSILVTIWAMMLISVNLNFEANTDLRPNNDGIYRVIVTDSDGNPVEEVAVQFCSDTACRFGETDENGIVEFHAEEGMIYSIHISDVPDGYEENTLEFKTLKHYCDICIVLQKMTDPEF